MAPRNSGSAVTALVLAIASFVVCPLIPAVIALFIASSAKKEIANSGGTVGGEGLVSAARVIAWINIGISVALIVLFVVIAIIAAVTSNDSTSVMGGAVVALA